MTSLIKRVSSWDPLLKSSVAAALAVLGPKLAALFNKNGNKRGQRHFAVLAATVAAVLAWQRWTKKDGHGDGGDEEEEEEPDVSPKFYAVALALGLLSAFYSKAPARSARFDKGLSLFVALSAAPTVAELVAHGEGDVPACLAMALGLLMGHPRAASVILLMVTGGERLEEIAMDRAGTALQTLLHENPGTARLENGQDIPAESVEPGMVFLVRTNEAVAVDGELVDGKAEIDEKLITGEGQSASKRKGDTVYAGTVNRGSQAVKVRATKPYSDSVFQQMKTTLAIALERKSHVELNSKRIADGLTPLTLLASTAGFLLSTIHRKSTLWQAWEVVLSVMMSATPCPAAIGVPVAMLSGMSLASRKLGSTIKSGDALEALADAKCVVFDKTGTLTFGEPAVKTFVTSPQGKKEEALKVVASVERLSKHVLADAVLKYWAGGASGEAPFEVTDYSETSGLGVSGTVDGRYKVFVGAHDFCGVEPDAKNDETLRAYFRVSSLDGPEVCRGMIAFSDPIRPDAAEIVGNLRKRGLQVHILSGDRSNHLRAVAEQLGVDGYRACLPHEKADHVVRLQKSVGKVIFVGDGANDTAALAASDVGVSVDASSLASESADVVVLSGDIGRVDGLIALSARSVRIARRTVGMGTMASLCQMVLAAAGLTTPLQNAVAQEVVDLSAVLHSMTAIL